MSDVIRFPYTLINNSGRYVLDDCWYVRLSYCDENLYYKLRIDYESKRVRLITRY